MQEEISFGVWLYKQRRALDLTRQAFADQVGCAEVTVRRIEGGTLKPSRELANIFLEKLGVSEVDRPQWILFARGLSGLPTQTIPSSNKPITNLPAALTSFIGRKKEQSEVIRQIDKHRLVTLTGSGGVGKTRLAIKVGEEVVENHPDGVWLVELAPILDPLLVSRTAAIAIGLRDEPQRPVIDMLSDYLREKQMLIILDNCEHLLDACAQLVDALLKRCPGLKILSTSREALSILGEAVYPVPSLELPDIQQMLEKFRDYESVLLFEERAQLTQMDFSLTIENAPSVSEICNRLDGIPLAIELAAARVNVHSTEQIAERLQKSYDLLTAGNRTALPRHQTLQAAIDWSYDLLSLLEQSLFQRLSVFVNGWTLDAAESICSDANIKSETILDALTQLINKSLVIMQEEHGKTRYRMLETIRQYANEKLVEAGESEALRDRHLEYFLDLSETAAPHLIRTEQLEWLDRLDDDYENIRAALKWALSKDSAELSIRLCAALGAYWIVRPYWLEGSMWLRGALSKSSQIQSAIEQTARVRALYHDAQLASALDDVERMTASAELSLELAKVGSDRLDTAIAGFYVGLTLKRHGDEKRAGTILRESLNEFRRLNASYWEAQAYRSYGFILVERGEITSLDWASQKLRLARIAGERFTLAESLLGYAGVIFKHTSDAIELIEEANSLCKQIGSPFNTSYFFLAELKWLIGDRKKAKYLYLEIEERYGVLGEKYMRSDAIAALGLLAMEDDKLSEAQNYFERALVTAQELEDKIFISWRLAELSKVFYLQGNMDKFKEKLQRSISAAKDIPPSWKIHPLVLILSTIYFQKPEVSTQVLGAIDAFFQMGHRYFDPRPLERYYDRAEAHTREVLGNAAFTSAFAEGQKISLDEALDLALKTVEEM